MSRDLDGDELVAVEPELAGAHVNRPSDGAIEVRIGDLAVIHTPEDARRRRPTTYAVIAAAAAVIALLVVVVPRLAQSGMSTAKVNASGAPPLAPPAPLSVTMSLSGTTVHAGSSITVNYSWNDGSGRLLYLNHVGITANQVVRLPPCGASSSVPKPSKGSGSWTFSLPLSGPLLIDGASLPFDHPERIRVGVQIGTGGQCGAVEEKTVTQWVTLYPNGT